MKTNILFLLLAYILLNIFVVYADQNIKIMGECIPIIEGAKPAKEELAKVADIRMATYEVFRPVNEVIGYYRDFFKGNNFLLIGGEEPDGFNASVRKENAMFTIRIFSKGDRSMLQFIW